MHILNEKKYVITCIPAKSERCALSFGIEIDYALVFPLMHH